MFTAARSRHIRAEFGARALADAGVCPKVLVQSLHDCTPGISVEKGGRIGDVTTSAFGAVGGVVDGESDGFPPGPW